MQSELDVKKIVGPILLNYDHHVRTFVRILDQIQCLLIYEGPSEFRHHIRDKTVYACSVRYFKTKTRVLHSVFPVMLGSKLDVGIRKRGLREFSHETLEQLENICNYSCEIFEEPDIGITFFVINGCLKQLPYFLTNDPTNMHIIKNSIVRCYAYDEDDRGKELSFYMDNIEENNKKHQRGELTVVLNDGSESIYIQSFFSHCPYPVNQECYMSKIYKEGSFDIDNLANKIVISPGHLFVKLFIKYLYLPLREGKWSSVKSKITIVVKSIESGSLLHVLSRKTLYFKECDSSPKMVSVPRESHREIGVNGEVYVEKNTGCYREVNLQTYPLNPYISYLIIRQISNKVKNNSKALAFQNSFIGYMCILGAWETKNVGRTNMMVRNTFVSTNYDMDPIVNNVPGQNLYSFLRLEPSTEKKHCYYIVINEACIPITESSFKKICLKELKRKFVFIECFQESNYIHIRFKVGLLFKKLHKHCWVTTRDELFWIEQIYGFPTKNQLIEKLGFKYITGFQVDLNPFFNHNAFPKNILAFNALKNAVLATDQSYSRYFMETVSAHTILTEQHEQVCPPIDFFSKHFVLYIPRVTVAYMTFMGNNQEDCIVVRDSLKVFDCFRFHTVRFKFHFTSTPENVMFYPIQGDISTEDEFLGTVVCHSIDDSCRMTVVSLSIHVKIVPVSDREAKLYFTKPNFRILQYDLTMERLSVSIDIFHPSSTGDKLCSFHGQKGVMRKFEHMPMFDNKIIPDLVINPYSIFRMTPGQIKEGLILGAGKDAQIVHNSDGELVPGAKAFYAKTFYFPVAYWSSEHIYTPLKNECTLDLILGQPVKGRSRRGSMRLGTMELMNCIRAIGLASCFEEKMLEHSDRILNSENILLPKSAYLCREDARFFKCQMNFEYRSCITEE